MKKSGFKTVIKKAVLNKRLIIILLIGCINISFAQVPINWQNTIGGTGQDRLASAFKTQDGGYILGGESRSNATGDKTENSFGNEDYWVVKTNQAGDVLWEKTIGGNGYDVLRKVLQTSDGGYLISGHSTSNISGNKTVSSHGSHDIWLVKLNASGNIIWQKSIGGSNLDLLGDIIETSDNGFILATSSGSGISGDKSEGSFGSLDCWILKLNPNGEIVWQKTLGGEQIERSYSILESDNGNFVLAATSNSGISGNKSQPNKGREDYWIVKLNENGTLIWERSIGGDGIDEVNQIIKINNDEYLISGQSHSNISGDKTENRKQPLDGSLGNYILPDCWLVKMGNDGEVIWDKTIGSHANEGRVNSLITSDSGILTISSTNAGISGDKNTIPKGEEDFWLVKLDANSNIQWERAIGGNGSDIITSLLQGNNSNYLIGGYSSSGLSGDKTENTIGNTDYWVMEVNTNSLENDYVNYFLDYGLDSCNSFDYFFQAFFYSYGYLGDSVYYSINFGTGDSISYQSIIGDPILLDTIFYSYPSPGTYYPSVHIIVGDSNITITDTIDVSNLAHGFSLSTITSIGDTFSFNQNNDLLTNYCNIDSIEIQLLAHSDSLSENTFYAFFYNYTTFESQWQPWLLYDSSYITGSFDFSIHLDTNYQISVRSGNCMQFFNILISDSCISDSIWPGDANSDGIANVYDVFPVGIGYNSTGPVRQNASNNWTAQYTNDWANTFNSGVNYKHADCNGDGVIDVADGLPILLNYGLTHNKEKGIEGTASDPELFFETDLDTVQVSSELSIPIHLGTLNTPANDVYGIAFTINMDPSLIDTSTMEVIFENSWLGSEGSDMMTIQKRFSSEGELHVGMVRTNQLNVNEGYGQIATLSIVVTDDLIGKMEDLFADLILSFSDVKIISYDESEIAVNTNEKLIVITEVSTGIQNSKVLSSSVQVYPNPAQDIINLSIQDNLLLGSQMELKDASGQTVYRSSLSRNAHQINLEHLSKGIYFLTIQSEKMGAISKKVSIMK